MTTFTNEDHWLLFLRDRNLATAERIKASEVILKALHEAGVLPYLTISETEPDDTSQPWLDKSSIPDTLRVYNSGTEEWEEAGEGIQALFEMAGLAEVTATATRAGLVELATAAETQAGTDTTRAVTPASFRGAFKSELGRSIPCVEDWRGSGGDPSDTAMFNAAIIAQQNARSGFYMPTANYTIEEPLTEITKPITITAQGQTWLSLTPDWEGACFSTSEVGINPLGVYVDATPVTEYISPLDPTANNAGVVFSGFQIVGSRESTERQDGIILNDRTDFSRISDIRFHGLTGSAFGGGNTKNTTLGYLRQSFIDRLIITLCGNGNDVPSFYINSTGPGDASNQISVNGIQNFWMCGPMTLENLHDSGLAKRFITMSGIQLHGQDISPQPALGIDLLRLVGDIFDLDMRGLEFNAGYATGWHIHMIANSTGSPRAVRLSGTLGTGTNGINIEAASGPIKLNFQGSFVSGTTLKVGSDVTVGMIEYNGEGSERDKVYEINPAAKHLVKIGHEEIVLADENISIAGANSTAEQVLATITVPAGWMGVNGSIEIETGWTFPNNANQVVPRVRWGGTGGTALLSANYANFQSLVDRRVVKNRNSVSSQVSGHQTAAWGHTTAALITASVNTAAETTIVISVACATGSDGPNTKLEWYRVKLRPKFI